MIELIAAVLLSLAAAQQPPPPPPPPPPPMRSPARDAGPELKGTGIIRGHVRTVEGRPLRRAQVRVTGTGLPNGRAVTTGLEGEYELTELPAGRFNIEFSRPGYLRYQHGQRYYGEPGSPVEIADGARLEKLDAVMVRGGVITGRVTDEMGDPVSGVDMWVMQQQFFRGRKQLVPVLVGPTHNETDDVGQYRMTSLPPGDYVVVARLRDTWMSDEKEPQMLSYAPTYHPGTANPLEAAKVRLAPGREVGGIDINLVAVRAAKLSGSAAGTDGMPMTSGTIALTQEIMGPSGGRMSMAGSTRIGPDGTWTMKDVPPGDYVIRAIGSAGSRASETALMQISVTGQDLEGLVLAADAGALLSGRVTTDTGDALPRAERLTFATSPLFMTTTAVRTTAGQDDGLVGADGAFLRRSFSGQVVARITGLPRGWAVKRVVVGGQDVTGLPFDLRPGQQVDDVSVVITSRFAGVSGTVMDTDGKPTRDATVLLYSTDPARWHEAAGNQRTARPDQSSRYRFDVVPPGEYFLVAVETMQQWQMNDPDFLKEQQERATKIVVRESEPVTADVQVVGR